MSQATLATPTVPGCTTSWYPMVKQKGRKVAAAAGRSTKDRQFKALQKGMGFLSDKEKDEGEEAELVPRTP